MLHRGVAFGLLAIAACVAAEIGGSCSDDTSCSLNGVCRNAICICDKPWGGPDCGLLRFKPSPVTGCGPACVYHGNASANVSTTWGGSVFQGDDKQYYMAMAEMANNCTLGQWTTNSQVALAVAAQPTGPYTRLQTIVRPWAHNPQMVRLPDGTYVVFTLGNGNGPQNGAQKNCVADSEGMDELPLPNTTDKRGVAATRPEMPPVISAANVTVNFTLHYSRDLKTWTAKQAFIPDFPAIDSMGNWNPAPVVMPDGRLRVMVHTDPAPWAGEMIVEAETFEGPYVPLTGDITTCDHCEEDPFMWTDARGNWHVLYHRMFDPAGGGPVPSPGWPGGHAFSRDGLQWSNISRCYTTGVELENGQHFETLRRERPKLLFNAAKQPTHLFNGVITENHGVYTMVAPLDLD